MSDYESESVPPAGGEVEVLRYMFDWAGAITSCGPVNWRVEVDRELPHPDFFKDGQAKNLVELVDSARVTRVQAENAQLVVDCWEACGGNDRRTDLLIALRLMSEAEDELTAERDALQVRLNESDELCGSLERSMKNHRHELGLVQQRLTAADERVDTAIAFVTRLIECAGTQPSIATGYLRDILDKLTQAEGGGDD